MQLFLYKHKRRERRKTKSSSPKCALAKQCICLQPTTKMRLVCLHLSSSSSNFSSNPLAQTPTNSNRAAETQLKRPLCTLQEQQRRQKNGNSLLHDSTVATTAATTIAATIGWGSAAAVSYLATR